MNQLIDEFYNIEEPTYSSLDKFQELKRRLKKNNILNVNVIENEWMKIKKEKNGTGARLETNLNPKDEKMQMFWATRPQPRYNKSPRP